MSDKGFEGFDKMSVDLVNESRRMADYIVRHVYRGPGDTIEAAMYRAEAIYGVPFEWLHRLRYRSQGLRDISGKALVALVSGYYQAACERVDTAYEKEKAYHAPHSALVRLADLVAGKANAQEVPPQEE